MFKISEAVIGPEYRLKSIRAGVNHAFEGARIKFKRLTGANWTVEFWQTGGMYGETSIWVSEENWMLEPIIKDWDF